LCGAPCLILALFFLIATFQSVTGSWTVSIAITSSLVSVVAAILGARELAKRRKAALCWTDRIKEACEGVVFVVLEERRHIWIAGGRGRDSQRTGVCQHNAKRQAPPKRLLWTGGITWSCENLLSLKRADCVMTVVARLPDPWREAFMERRFYCSVFADSRTLGTST